MNGRRHPATDFYTALMLRGYRPMDRDEAEAFVDEIRNEPPIRRVIIQGMIGPAGSMSWFVQPLACPYCGHPVERTVTPDEIHLCGEHCDTCALPFGIDEHGDPYGQDDPRWME